MMSQDNSICVRLCLSPDVCSMMSQDLNGGEPGLQHMSEQEPAMLACGWLWLLS